jgi:hypothetical protein
MTQTIKLFLACFLLAVLVSLAPFADDSSPFDFGLWEFPPGVQLNAAGVSLIHKSNPVLRMYLWMYEWNLFEAVDAGEHTHGYTLQERWVSDDRHKASVSGHDLSFDFTAVSDGAVVSLTVRNGSDHDWPPYAGIIPCFNPGPPRVRNTQFVDDEHARTYFLGPDGLEPFQAREIHFNQALRPLIDKVSPSGQFVFSGKWPTSPRNAVAGLIIRESADGQSVSGIAWEDFVSAQGHNPWKCMHLSVRVGPLKKGASKTIKGRIYLLNGNRNDCLAKYRQDFK